MIRGAFLLLLAAGSFRKRPSPGQRAVLPKWLRTIDSPTAGTSGLLGMLSPLGGGLTPTNLLPIAGAMVTLSQSNLAPGDDALAILVFTLIWVSTVAAPVVISWAAGKKARPVLDTAKAWLSQNDAAVTAALLLVIGAVLTGQRVNGSSA